MAFEAKDGREFDTKEECDKWNKKLNIYHNTLKLVQFKKNPQGIQRKQFLRGHGYFQISKKVYDELYQGIRAYIYEYEYDLFMCFLVNPKGTIVNHLSQRKSPGLDLLLIYLAIDDSLRYWGGAYIRKQVEDGKHENIVFKRLNTV